MSLVLTPTLFLIVIYYFTQLPPLLISLQGDYVLPERSNVRCVNLHVPDTWARIHQRTTQYMSQACVCVGEFK